MSLKKRTLVICIICFSSALSLAKLLGSNGLDNNADQNIDLTLETPSLEEHVFSNVADLIAGFVVTQYQIRETLRKEILDDPKSFDEEDSETVILKDLPQNGVYATRDVHRKTHGCLNAEFKVNDNFQDESNKVLQQFRTERKGSSVVEKSLIPDLIDDKAELGLFIPGAEYSALVRLSNGHPANRHDMEPDARGFAVKFLSKTEGLNQDALTINKNTQLDILTINYPTFFVNSGTKYHIINRWFLKSAEDDRSLISSKLFEGFAVFGPSTIGGASLTGLEKLLTLKVNGSIIDNPFRESYFSMVPSRLGIKGAKRAVKYKWSPVNCDKGDDLYNASWERKHDYAKIGSVSKFFTPPFRQSWDRYYLRERAKETLEQGDVCYKLSVQYYRDQQSTNIEDSLDIWLSSEKERSHWIETVVEQLPENEDTAQYLQKIMKKHISPLVTVGQLRVSSMQNREFTKNSQFCEDLSFNPWNGNMAIHKPLGQVSRLKQKVYNTVRRTRHKLNKIDSQKLERISTY